MEIQWPLVVFSLLCGSGGCMLAATGVAEFLGIGAKLRVKSIIAAFVLVVLGGCFVLLHLAQPSNVMGAFSHIGSLSPISVEMLAVGVNAIVAIVYFFMARGENPNDAALKAVGAVAVIAGLLIAFVTGNGYVMESQPAWNNIGLPLGYLGSALAAGFGLYGCLLVASKVDAAEVTTFSTYVIGAGIVALVLMLVYALMNGMTVNPVAYWLGAIIVGGAGVAAAGFVARKSASSLYLAAACGVVGALCFRVTMWLACTGYLDLFSDAAVRGVLGL